MNVEWHSQSAITIQTEVTAVTFGFQESSHGILSFLRLRSSYGPVQGGSIERSISRYISISSWLVLATEVAAIGPILRM
jgi:hypothetical protein